MVKDKQQKMWRRIGPGQPRAWLIGA